MERPNIRLHTEFTADFLEYSQAPLKHGLISHGITHDTAITVAESESDIRIATDTP